MTEPDNLSADQDEANLKQVKASIEVSLLQLQLLLEIYRIVKIEPEVRALFPVNFPPIDKIDGTDRRLLTKSIFSFIEASVFATKAWIAAHCEAALISHAEMDFVREITRELGEDGEVKTRRAKISFSSNVLFCLRLVYRAGGEELHGVKDSPGWANLKRSTKVRDRLMHPKSTDDIKVSDDDIRDVIGCFEWFTGFLWAGTDKAMKAFPRYQNKS